MNGDHAALIGAVGGLYASGERHRCRQRGLTLTELVVVLAILGLLASALFPSAAYVFSRARERDAQASLVDSWRLARAMSRACDTPVWWRARQTKEGLELGVWPPRDPAAARTVVLTGWKLRGDGDVAPVEPQILVAPHGLSEDVVLTLSREGSPTMRVVLPGVMNESNPHTSVQSASASLAE